MALQKLESNPQLSFPTRMEDWTSLGQHKRHPEFLVVTRESRRNSGKTTWFPSHRKMKLFPATAPQEKSHVRNWRSKRCLAPLIRPHKVPRHPGLPGEVYRGLPAPLPLSPFYPPHLDRRVDSHALSGRGSNKIVAENGGETRQDLGVVREFFPRCWTDSPSLPSELLTSPPSITALPTLF